MGGNNNDDGIKLLFNYIAERFGAGKKPPFTDEELAELNEYKDKLIAEGKLHPDIGIIKNPIPMEIKSVSVSTHAAKRMAYYNGEIELEMTGRKEFKRIKAIIDAWDPLNLFRSMCPPDEYDVEVEEIIYLVSITKDDMDSIVYFLLECFFEDCYEDKNEKYSPANNPKIGSCIEIGEMILKALKIA